MPGWKKWTLGILVVLLFLMAGFVVWGSTPARPLASVEAALLSDNRVEVRQGNWLIFSPQGQTPRAGFIFYPGGHVDYRAYAPYARAIAEQGYLVVIVRMPLSLAVIAPESAGDVIGVNSHIAHWAVGGHSLGGSMAARFAMTSPGLVQGLVLWASYPASSDDLSSSGLAVASIYGTRDGLATPEKVLAAKPLLPSGTQWVAVEGGNHAQFGWYGPQNGDQPAEISPAEQQAQVVAATVALLKQISELP